MSRIVLPAVAFLFASVGFAQNCSIDGTVVNLSTNAPIARAHVTVAGRDDSFVADTDAAGKWRLGNLACGRVTISAVRPGFIRIPQGAPFEVKAGVPLRDVKIELIPQAVLAGRVLDDQGDPVQGAQVNVLTTRIINGIRGVQASNSMVANDLGEYRFAGLAAGKYFVCANGPPAVLATGAPPIGERCYPGPLEGGAAGAMNVSAGYEGRIDFTLSPLAAFNVSGVVSGYPEGTTGLVTLTPRRQVARIMGLSAQVHPDGTFLIRGVAAGSYTVSARAAQLNNRLMARAPVDVAGSDVNGIQLRLEAGVTVTGAMKIISVAGKKPAKPQYTLLLRSSEGSVGPGISGWDETRTTFSIDDVMPGSYRLEFSPPAPFYLKSATMGGRDMLASDVPIGPGATAIEVVISDDGGVVEGDVTADDMPTAAWIYLERNGVPSRNAVADSKGHFRIEGLPPGNYKVYAWDDNTRVEYGNPEWMTRNGKGVSVSIGEGETAQVKLVRQVAPSE